MAVLREHITLEDKINYLATLAFICGISCVVLMLKFGGFKASLNFYNGKRKSKEREDITPVSMSGAYRTNRDEFFGYSNNIESQVKLSSASTPGTTVPPLRSVKSTNDLIKHKNLPPNLRQTHPSISQDPRGEPPQQTRNEPKKDRRKLDAEKKVEKQRQLEQKKLEKQRLEDEKKLEKQRTEERKLRERQTAFEQAKQDKLRKEEEKRQAEQLKRDRKKKGAAPKPLSNPLAQNTLQYSSNTLESSISRTSGPPPYSEVPKPESVRNTDTTGNITFSKPIDTGSWDLISQHRQQINRNVQSTPDRKQVVMDLKFNVDSANDNVDNSEV